MEKVLRRVQDQGSGMWEPGDITALPTGGRVGAWVTNEAAAAEIPVTPDVGAQNCQVIPAPKQHILTLSCIVAYLTSQKKKRTHSHLPYLPLIR